MYRIGHGFDIHRFCDNRPLMLGGVDIPYDKGLEGHSDADVLLHALCNGILGASGKGDIGDHFPTTDPVFKNIQSSVLVRKTIDMITSDFRIVNVDFSIIAEEPKLGSYKTIIKANVADLLGVTSNIINIKAGTNEKMDSIGNCKAIAVYCSVLLKKL